MQPLAGTIPPIAVDPSPVSFGLCVRERMRLPAAAQRNTTSLFVLALLAAVLVWPAQPALADFTQNQPKLVGTGAVGASQQGSSVALSGDGKTAIVGGDLDNNGVGAAWVFTRSGGVWNQQGNKLVGTFAVGQALSRRLRRAVCRRQHRHRGRAW